MRGTYWVEVSTGGLDFTVLGMLDADPDGEPTHHTATRTEDTTLITPDDVY